MTHHFTVAPNSPTGAEHTIGVVVHETRDAMLAALTVEFPDGGWYERGPGGTLASGAFLNTGGYAHNDAPVDLGTIHLCEEWLDLSVIAHEATHAAMHVYYCDVLGIYSRAVRHIASTNEAIAYLIGDLVGDIGEKLYERGLFADQQTILDEVDKVL